MKAYVSIRGSRSPRRVDRDASPGPHSPYVSLVFPDADGGRGCRFELIWRPLPDGGAEVALTRTDRYHEMVVVHSEEVEEQPL